MGDAKKPRATTLVAVATFLTLVVTVVRTVGEFQGWDPRWFASDPGPMSGLFDIVWLVPVFGFLFGRRLAQAGSQAPFVAAFFVPMFAWVCLVSVGGYAVSVLEGDRLLEVAQWILYGGPLLLLSALFAWPKAFVTNLLYAVLARLPVAMIQYLDVENGWQTHYGKLPPRLPALGVDERQWWLAMIECGFWLPFTVLLASGAAAVGGATVRAR